MTQIDPISHRIYLPGLTEATGAKISVTGAEAHHAVRVKRLRTGEGVELFDGLGGTLAATLVSWQGSKQNPTILLERQGDRNHAEPSVPSVQIICPPPKPDRLGPMVDQLSQIGAAAWFPMASARTQGQNLEFNQEKMNRIVVESAKQCRRDWLMEIGAPVTFHQAIEQPGAVLFDITGGPISSIPPTDPVLGLIGPEGGWSPEELKAAKDAGLPVIRVGAHVLRLETAAVVAAISLCTGSR